MVNGTMSAFAVVKLKQPAAWGFVLLIASYQIQRGLLNREVKGVFRAIARYVVEQ